jgi:hypothetical protein
MRINTGNETLDFEEIKTVFSDNDCNTLIISGWKILHVGATHIDTNGFNCKTTFILGKPNNNTGSVNE